MKVYLVHHADVLTPAQDPQRHLSPQGQRECARLAARFKALGVAPVRLLHSELQWSLETAQRIAAGLGMAGKAVRAAYPVNTGDPLAPFLAEIAAAGGDIMMCGHVDYLLRTASQLVCGNEACKVVEFKPGNGTAVCIEGEGNRWVITWAWRQDHAPG